MSVKVKRNVKNTEPKSLHEIILHLFGERKDYKREFCSEQEIELSKFLLHALYDYKTFKLKGFTRGISTADIEGFISLRNQDEGLNYSKKLVNKFTNVFISKESFLLFMKNEPDARYLESAEKVRLAFSDGLPINIKSQMKASIKQYKDQAHLVRDEMAALRERYKSNPVWSEPTKRQLTGQDNQDAVLVEYRKLADIRDLIAKGEGNYLEFKETLFTNIRTGKEDAEITKEALKTIAAFLNTSGGILLIGVSKEGEIKGIQKDYQFCPKKTKNNDGFQLKFRDKLLTIQKQYSPNKIKIDFEETFAGIICRVDIPSSPTEIYLNDEFYVREGNRSRKLSLPEHASWIKSRYIEK